MKKNSSTISAILIFIVSTIFIAFPVLKSVRTGLPISNEGLGPQDSLLSLWILSWDLHKFKIGLTGFFDANIFFPYKNTLAYSEHLIGEAIFAFPLSLFIKNTVLVYNIILFGSFVMSGIGMYLLAYRLTQDRSASIIAGIIFAFFPYHYLHLSRLQLLMMQWIPFTFLFLHRFLDEPNHKNIIMASLFLSLQFLSCMYYGIYLSFFALLFILLFFAKKRYFADFSFFMKFGIFALIAILLIVPLHLPYMDVKSSLGFSRNITENFAYSADIKSYITPPKFNKFWGLIDMKRPWNEAGSVFFGLSPVLLSIIGLFLSRNKIGSYSNDNNCRNFYGVVIFTAFLLSLGPIIHFGGKEIIRGPYMLLYYYFPGFNGLRAPNRISIFVAFGISVLAAYGVKTITIKLRGKILKQVIVSIIAIIILLEYLPTNLKALTVGDYNNIPPVYKWLSQEKGDISILEYPLLKPQVEEVWYVYYSIFHWKKMVNGYSGFTPPLYDQIKDKTKILPSNEAIQFLKGVGIRYIIVHTKRFSSKDEAEKTIAGMLLISDVRLIKQFEDDFAFEIRIS